MIKQLHKQKLLVSGLLILFVLSQTVSINGKTQAVKSKTKMVGKTQAVKSKTKAECAKCPTSNQGGEPCPDCPIPEDVDPHDNRPIPMGTPCCGHSRHQHPLSESATRRVEPKYPEEAKKKGIKGNVVVEVTIDEKGNVISARALYGDNLLRPAAIEAAKGWRFTPTQLSGKPVKVVGTITFVFKDTDATK
jgi:TonB family protein